MSGFQNVVAIILERIFGNLVIGLGTLGAQNCISWGTLGAQLGQKVTWGTLGAQAVGAHLGQKSDLKHSFCKLNTLGAQSYLRHTWGRYSCNM